jgi:DNA-binding winged helix-turn-helix (wHTH) protein
MYNSQSGKDKIVSLRLKWRMGDSSASHFRFGIYELDLKTGELRKAGVLINLPPQPFKILALLASHAGDLVTREQIQREIWGTETFVDFEKGLNFAIKKIREALGDDAGSPRYVETLPRRGYRFIAPVERVPDSRDSAHPVAPRFAVPNWSNPSTLLPETRPYRSSCDGRKPHLRLNFLETPAIAGFSWLQAGPSYWLLA